MDDRTQLLRHTLAGGEYRWEAGAAHGWDAERERVFSALARFDERLRVGQEQPADRVEFDGDASARRV
jgi:hypothetical protein